MSDATRPFEIPLYNQRRLFGVFLAAHAIPDAVNVMHTGVGCKPKAQRQIVRHDRMREAQNKMVWSDVSDAHLIAGSGEQLRNIAVETYHRREGVGLILLSDSTAMELTGVDLPAVAREIEAQVGCPVVHVPGAGHRGDHYAGYADVVRVVLAKLPWDRPVTRPHQINLIGYPFDRYELDHRANLREVRRLLVGIGAELGPTFLSGAPLSALQGAPESAANVILPYGPVLEGPLPEGISNRPDCAPPLPLSGRATSRFLEQVATCLSLPQSRVTRIVERERAKIAPLLRIAREQLAGQRAAVLADTPRAVGLTATLEELGVRVQLVGLLDESLGGVPAYAHALENLGLAVPSDRVVLPCPTAQEIEQAWGALSASKGAPPVEVLLMPDLWLPPTLVAEVPRVEIGLPSNRKRALFGLPDLGYNGVVALAQRLLDALNRVH